MCCRARNGEGLIRFPDACRSSVGGGCCPSSRLAVFIVFIVLRRLFVFISRCYIVLRRVLQLAVLRLRSAESKELEIVVLRQELAASATTVAKLLREAGLRPAGDREHHSPLYSAA
jgi:hypothetical protein